MTFALRIFLCAIALLLAACIVWAGFIANSHLFDDGGKILEEPWGVVTMVDLYVGFTVAGLIILIVEPNKWVGAAWAAPIFILGNVVTAVWLVVRAPLLVAKFARKDDASGEAPGERAEG